MDRAPSPLSLPELCVHLAGGTLADWIYLVERFGPPRRGWTAALDAPDGALLAPQPGPRPDAPPRRPPSPARLARIKQLLRDPRPAREEFRRCGRAGLRLVPARREDCPDGLHHLPQPPLALVVRGRWPVVGDALAIVGSRAATPYGRWAAQRLSRAATRAGLVIVSGLARGIDRFALEATLEAGGWPVAVLGCGADVAYPPEHAELQERIAREGTLVTEFPLGRRPDRLAFPRRNRILAALARAVLVVEAGPRSGALITARHALEIGREVLAVPGPIDSETSRGANRLLADGATLIADVPSLLAALGRDGPAAAAATGRPGEPPLLAALDGRPRPIDEIARRARLDIGCARAGLIGLELEGLARCLAGGLYVRREAGDEH